MHAFTPIVALVSLAAFAAAIRNPNNPADPINCPPSGGADLCSKETKVSWAFVAIYSPASDALTAPLNCYYLSC